MKRLLPVALIVLTAVGFGGFAWGDNAAFQVPVGEGVAALVRPNGTVTFGAPTGHVTYDVNRKVTRLGDVYIKYGPDEKAVRVGSVAITYDEKGRLKRLGSTVFVYGEDGRIKRLGGSQIFYHENGDLKFVNGTDCPHVFVGLE